MIEEIDDLNDPILAKDEELLRKVSDRILQQGHVNRKQLLTINRIHGDAFA